MKISAEFNIILTFKEAVALKKWLGKRSDKIGV